MSFEELAAYMEQVKQLGHQQGFVYIAKEKHTGIVKVGYSINPIKRCREIAHDFAWKMAGFFKQCGVEKPEFELVTVVAATKEVEWIILRLLRGVNIWGEFFYPSPFVDAVISVLEILRRHRYRISIEYMGEDYFLYMMDRLNRWCMLNESGVLEGDQPTLNLIGFSDETPCSTDGNEEVTQKFEIAAIVDVGGEKPRIISMWIED